ncbi:MAG TPA: IPT/TIG domain-containing protein [Planctomycetota bacterium]|nr:IPT/TIG domain-containing protein [Planctomycetota bacterium]
MTRSLSTLFVTTLLAVPAGAQLAQSANYRLDGFDFAGGGGNAASSGFAAYAALDPLSGSEMSGATTKAVLGFVGSWDTTFPATAPIVFGVDLPVGSTAGGAPIEVSGMNFDKLGAGATLALTVGGVPAFGVAVASNTRLTAVAPPGASGMKDVAVSTIHGSSTLFSGIDYTPDLAPFGAGTPGCAGPHALTATSLPATGNSAFQLYCTHAPASALGLGLLGPVANPGGLDPGIGALLHVDLFSPGVILADFASDADGRGSLEIQIPDNPVLVGASFHAQALWYWSFACALGPFSLSASPGLTMTFE